MSLDDVLEALRNENAKSTSSPEKASDEKPDIENVDVNLLLVKPEPFDSFFEASRSESPSSSFPEALDGGSTSSKNNTSEKYKPSWFPSRSGRSIVWDHISWIDSTQRAACNYCGAEFQIKGGTSAVLRHLKAIHPAAIDFDPETAPPIKKKKKKMDTDFSIITDDTRSYMDNLLKQFMPEQDLELKHIVPQEMAQARADSEIDEVIRNLHQQDTTEPEGPPSDNGDHDIQKILRILDDQPSVVEDIGVNPNGAPSSPAPTPLEEVLRRNVDKNENRNESIVPPFIPSHLYSNNPFLPKNAFQNQNPWSQNPRSRRKNEDKSMDPSEKPQKFGKFSMALLSSIRRAPQPESVPSPDLPASSNSVSATTSTPSTSNPNFPHNVPTPNGNGNNPLANMAHMNGHPPNGFSNGNGLFPNGMHPSNFNPMHMNMKGGRPMMDCGPHPQMPPMPGPLPPGHPMAMQFRNAGVLDFEAKILYNQSLHATIAREEAMANYYRVKTRLIEVQLKNAEKESASNDEKIVNDEPNAESPIDVEEEMKLN